MATDRAVAEDRAALRLGVAGLGVAGLALLPYIDSHPGVELTAGADPRPEARQAFAAGRDGVAVYDTVEALCASGAVDCVYLATPTHLHAEHAIAAAAAGKHVVVEKPMAVTMEQARAMVAAADAAGVVLMVGHSQSYEPAMAAIRGLIERGELGRLRAVNGWYFTDWLYRPRRPEELDPARGGGVTMRQGAHHFDVLRYLGGGMLASVRGSCGVWDADRPADGSYSAYLEFADGAAATVFYSGHDHFPSTELTFGIGENGQLLEPDYGRARRALGAAPDASAEAALKSAPNGNRQQTLLRQGEHPAFFGLMVVSCERADVRLSPAGLLVYDDEQRREISLAGTAPGRTRLLDELVDAARDVIAPEHDGRWGMATLEVCIALATSSREHREIRLTDQVPLARKRSEVQA